MNILTNGTEFLHPQAPLGALLRHTATPPASRPTSSLVYGPVRQEIEPRGTNPWWGRYESGDLLSIELQPGRTRGLEIEVLDENFRVLTRVSADESVNTLGVRILRAGVHHVRVRNPRCIEGDYLLVLRVQRHALIPTQAGVGRLRRTAFVALRRAAGLL